MPSPDDPRLPAQGRLEERADALEARTRRKAQDYAHQASAQGYRLMAVLLGGLLAGLGLGLGLDVVAHTAPFGIIGGTLIGFAVSVFAAVRTAQAMSAANASILGPPQDLPADQDGDIEE